MKGGGGECSIVTQNTQVSHSAQLYMKLESRQMAEMHLDK
jgi:hypothetical protein